MKSPSGDPRVKDKRYWHLPDAKRLITMWRYWQKLVFHYSSDKMVFQGSPEWESAMHDLVSKLTAGGITCVNVGPVFLKLKSLGVQRSLHKWKNHATTISILGDHLRERIMAIHEGMNGWTSMQAAVQKH